MLIEIVFEGSIQHFDTNFLETLINQSRLTYVNSPEITRLNTGDELIDIIHSANYVDLVINTDHLNICQKLVDKVFVNFEKDKLKIKMLFFFDTNSVNQSDIISIDILRRWSVEIKNTYHFDYYICQIDNANKDEYFFDSNGDGMLLKN